MEKEKNESVKFVKVLIGLVAVLLLLLFTQSFFMFSLHKQVKQLQSGEEAQVVTARPYHRYGTKPTKEPESSKQETRRRTPGQLSSEEWEPIEEMEHMQSRINHMFRESFNRGREGVGPFADTALPDSFEPDADVKELKDKYVIRLDLPGMEKDKINVEVNNNALQISGERHTEKEEENPSGFRSVERSYGSFSRMIPIPADADAEKVSAEYKDGVLNISMPKILSSDAKKTASKIQVA